VERNPSEDDITKGLDLADYLTRFDYRLFRQYQTQDEPNGAATGRNPATGQQNKPNKALNYPAVYRTAEPACLVE